MMKNHAYSQEKQGALAMPDIPAYFAALADIATRIPEDDLRAATQLIQSAYQDDRTIFVIGNGQSATTATAFALDLTKGASGPYRRFRVIALTDNMAAITAWANDADYEAVFAEQLVSLFRPGDLLLTISASGNSPNVLAAAAWVREHQGRTIALAGFGGGRLSRMADVAVVVPSDDYGYVETAHVAICHYWVDAMRDWLASGAGTDAPAARTA
jgi:D-sedoheptulose 7-phosphate isomerase